MNVARQPSLRPADVVITLALTATPNMLYEELSARLHLSLGAVHGGVRRLQSAMLLIPGTRLPNRPNLKEFLLFGVPYVFFPSLGAITRGVPTAHSAPPLRDAFTGGGDLVWPSPDGTVRGESITPLYPGAPLLAGEDPELYGALTVIDVLRVGQSRERERAREWLASYLAQR
ncbi:MAG TPA: hypothetical protein VF092_05050 [Longimicrobium sp.]